MARLLTPFLLLGVAAACGSEPHVTEQRVYLDVSDFCGSTLIGFVDDIQNRSISFDLMVVDAAALDEARVEVVGRSPCTAVDIGDDFVELQLDIIAAVLELLDGLPQLSARGQYGLVGGVYWDSAVCSADGSAPLACGMSERFGNTEAPDPDELKYWLTCPSRRDACLADDDCVRGVCQRTETVCARDEQCQGATCGDQGVCRDGVCENASGTCLAPLCPAEARCHGASCTTPAGDPCVPGTCQDYVQDQELGPLYPIAHPYCQVLYDDALAAD